MPTPALSCNRLLARRSQLVAREPLKRSQPCRATPSIVRSNPARTNPHLMSALEQSAGMFASNQMESSRHPAQRSRMDPDHLSGLVRATTSADHSSGAPSRLLHARDVKAPPPASEPREWEFGAHSRSSDLGPIDFAWDPHSDYGEQRQRALKDRQKHAMVKCWLWQEHEKGRSPLLGSQKFSIDDSILRDPDALQAILCSGCETRRRAA